MFNYNNSGIGGNVMKNLENIKKEVKKTLILLDDQSDSIDLVFELLSMAVTIIKTYSLFVEKDKIDEYLFASSEHMKMYIDRCFKTETTKH